MKKKSFSLLGYVLGGILFCSWIAFLFLDAKKSHHLEPEREEVNNSVEVQLNQEHSPLPSMEKKDLTVEKPIQLSGFLETQEPLSAQKIETLGDVKEKIELLEKLFEQKKTSEVASVLLEAYMLDNQFDAAKRFYLSLSDSIHSQLDQGLDFKIGIQTFSQTSDTEYKNLKLLLEQKYQQKIFSKSERKYYAVMFALVDHRYSSAKAGMQELYGTKYEKFAYDIQSAFDQYEALKDVPEYYQDALIAYQLMNHGFLASAKKMVLPIVNQYPNYILPYQILANVEFTMGKWEPASRYFSQLLELDYQEKSLYLYHLGMSYFRLKKYSDAVVYLAQISDPRILLDSDRYLILSYIALGEEERVFAGWKRLLSYSTIKKSDFYSFFEEAFWKPYRLGKKSSYLQKKAKLVHSYILACDKRLAGADREVCTYGKLGLAAQNGAIENLKLEIYRFAKKYPKSEFFQLLAQIEEKKGNVKEATAALMRALGLSSSSKQRAFLKKEILRINDLSK